MMKELFDPKRKENEPKNILARNLKNCALNLKQSRDYLLPR